MTGDLSAHVVARMSHDLANPLGAIGNGIELLELTAAASSAEIGLIKDATAAAQARLRFLRVALGTAGPTGGGTADMLANWNQISKAKASLDGTVPDALRRPLALALMCCGDALALGGAIAVTAQENRLSLSASADKLLPQDAGWQHLENGTDLAPKAAHIHFNLLRQEIESAGFSIQIDESPKGLSLTLSA